MNKEELLNELIVKLDTGEITRDELFMLAGPDEPREDEGVVSVGKKIAQFSFTKMLYILGAAIATIGIIIFVGQIWEDIGSFARISVTLGLGLLFAALGSMLLKQKPDEKIGIIVHFIGGMLIPSGALVMLTELRVDTISLWPVTLTFGAIFSFYLALAIIHRNPLLTLFATANGTAFLYLLVETIIQGPAYEHADLYAYLTMVIGISYLLLGHALREGWNKILEGAYYFFGSVGFLGAAFTRVFDSGIWELLYFVLVFGGVLLSVYMKSRSILIASTLFLIAHVIYITDEYFADSLGWPISLVLLGFVFIGLGYGSVAINKKYINGEEV